MVKVINAHLREGANGSFVSLELQGDLELVQSQTTGRFYATARRCFISSTFDINVAKQFVGKTIKGSIIRVETDPYDYTVPETGEVITLAHNYDFLPEEESTSTPEPEYV